MAEGQFVRVEIDLTTGKLGLECSESSVDTILNRLAEFLPKFREHAHDGVRQRSHHPSDTVQLHESKASNGSAKSVNGSGEVGTKKRSAPTRSVAVLEARTEVQNLQLRVDEAELLPWSNLDKDWKKFLWILEASRSKGVDGLTNAEISYLMDKTFREVRAAKAVNNLKKKIKDRFVQPMTVIVEGKSLSIWRILADGSKEVTQAAGPNNA